jgi:hypothetical protein
MFSGQFEQQRKFVLVTNNPRKHLRKHLAPSLRRIGRKSPLPPFFDNLLQGASQANLLDLPSQEGIDNPGHLQALLENHGPYNSVMHLLDQPFELELVDHLDVPLLVVGQGPVCAQLLDDVAVAPDYYRDLVLVHLVVVTPLRAPAFSRFVTDWLPGTQSPFVLQLAQDQDCEIVVFEVLGEVVLLHELLGVLEALAFEPKVLLLGDVAQLVHLLEVGLEVGPRWVEGVVALLFRGVNTFLQISNFFLRVRPHFDRYFKYPLLAIINTGHLLLPNKIIIANALNPLQSTLAAHREHDRDLRLLQKQHLKRFQIRDQTERPVRRRQDFGGRWGTN